jgi:hypothetical protein
MVSTQPSSQAEQIASNTWLGPHGGCIFADGPNAGTSAAATVHQVSMHQNITPLRVTRSSRASSRARIGSTTIVQSNSSSARSFALRTRIRRINRRRDRQKRCRQTGQRCFTNKRLLSGFRSRRHGCWRSPSCKRPVTTRCLPKGKGTYW